MRSITTTTRWLLAKQKKFDEAQAELTKAAQLDPPQAGKYYYNIGAVLVNTGQMEPAGEAFKKAIEIDPNYADAHYQYGIYLIGKATTTADGKITRAAGTDGRVPEVPGAASRTGRTPSPPKAMLHVDRRHGGDEVTASRAPGSRPLPPRRSPNERCQVICSGRSVSDRQRAGHQRSCDR